MNGATIGIVCPRYAPALGGVERHAELLARGIAARGYTVEIITTDPTRQLPSVEVRDGITVRRFPTVADDSVFFVAPKLGWWLLRNAHRYDLLHAHSYHTPLAFQATLAARRAGIPLVFTPHYHGTGHSPFRALIHRPYRVVGAWLFGEATRVVCVSEVERQLIRQHFGESVPISVIPNGVERTYLQPHDPPPASDTTSVLTVGRLDHYKQADRIVKALPYLPRWYHVTIIGNGPARAEIQGLAAQPTPRIQLPGQVSDATLLAAYRSADVFVSLSRQESFGMTVLEAAVSGAAVVASDIPAHREVARYVAPGRFRFVDVDATPVDIAQAIACAAGSGRADDIAGWDVPTWDSATDALEALYADVLAPAVHHPNRTHA